MGNYLLPFRAGEVMRAVSVGQTQNISKAAALGSIDLERAFDGVLSSLTLSGAGRSAPSSLGDAGQSHFSPSRGVIPGVSKCDAASMKRSMDRAGNNTIPESFAGRLKAIAEEFLQGMKGVNCAGALWPVSLLS